MSHSGQLLAIDESYSYLQPTVDRIRAIGTAYLKAHKKSKWFRFLNIFHTNHPTAQKLQNYTPSPDATDKQHEIFLMCCFLELPKYHGELATNIKNIFEEEFDHKLSPDYLKLNFSLEALQNIGMVYLRKHPTKTRFHGNQLIATDMEDFEMSNPTPRQLWFQLLNFYESLSDASGELAKSISNIIEYAFSIEITFAEAAGEQIRKLHTSEIAKELREIIKNHLDFAEKNRPMRSLQKSTTFNNGKPTSSLPSSKTFSGRIGPI